MKHFFIVTALVLVGTACKQREFKGDSHAQSTQSGVSTLVGKKLVITCLNPANRETVVATTMENVKSLEAKIPADVKWPQGTFSVAGTIIPFDETAGDDSYWRIEVKFLAPAFYASWINATFDKKTLKSLDGSTATFPSTGNDVILVNCDLKISDSGTAATYTCPAIRSFPPVTFPSLDSCKAKCPKSDDPAQQCQKVVGGRE
jgi:hypothetical protein